MLRSNSIYKWVVLTASITTYIFVGASQLASVSPSIPIFMEFFNINATIAGLLTSVWALARTIISLPAGGIATRFGGRDAYVFGVITSIAGWIIVTVAPDYLTILTGRFVMGLGTGTMSVAGPIVISEWFPKGKLSTAMGLWSMVMPLGILWELPLIAWLISIWGWRQTYALFLIISSATLAPLLIILRKPPPYPLIVESTDESPRISKILGDRSFVAACTAVFFGLSIWGIYSTYVVKWCMTMGYNYMTASLLASSLYIACVVAEVATGHLSDKLLQGRLKPFFLGGALLSSLATLSLPYAPHELLITLLIIVSVGIGVAPITVAMFAIPIKIVKPEERGIAMGIAGMFIYSSYMLTLLTGYIFDTYGLTAAIIITSLIGFISTSITALGIKLRI